MKYQRVIPCICTSEEMAADGKSGMPVLGTYIRDGEIWFAPCCLQCGRGNRYKGEKTPEEALDNWNELQTRLRNNIPESTRKAIQKDVARMDGDRI